MSIGGRVRRSVTSQSRWFRQRLVGMLEIRDGRRSAWHDLLPFTTHRIRLAADRYTAERGVDPEHDARTALVVEAAAGLGGLEQCSVVDLGCLEGGFALEFARRGAKRVLGIECRAESVARCELARDLMQLPDVRFVLGDVTTELAASVDTYDIVFAAGILYHLDRPDEMLRAMRAKCTGFVLLDTHVATPDRITHNCSAEIAVRRAAEGAEYRGRWFCEFDPNWSRRERNANPLASAGNQTSFWPFEDDLVRMIKDAGFDEVSKVNAVGPLPWQVDQTNRVLYLCRI
jgi:2-polyprenyl-3-methyl-5-hydroxy-6-metoxy-1,4-benzoquinol methylase